MYDITTIHHRIEHRVHLRTMTDSQSNPTWVNQSKPEPVTEDQPLISGSMTDFKASIQSRLSGLKLFFDPFYYAPVLVVYITILSFLANGQQHMDWSIPSSTWAILITIGQVITTPLCAYYWKKLRVVNPVVYPLKNEALLMSTSAMLLFFYLSVDIYFITCYAAAYDTLLGHDTLAQRQFDSFFNLINVSVITSLPYSAYFFVQHWRSGSKYE